MTRTCIYRHFDAEGRLLYVGITAHLGERDKYHAATAVWHHAVVRSDVQWCLSREHAADLERVAVKHEQPLYNVTLRPLRAAEVNAGLEENLIAEIEAAALSLGLQPSTVGERAGQGGRLYARLKDGKRVWPQTAAKVRDWIAAHCGEAS